MTVTHTVTVDHELDGDVSSVRFACTGGPEHVCHQWCTEPSCEEHCSGQPIRLWTAEVPTDELVAQAPLAGHRWGAYADGNSCRIVDWLDAVDWADSGWTEDGEQITASLLRPGTHVIEEEWTGGDYVWRYADVEPAVTVAVPS